MKTLTFQAILSGILLASVCHSATLICPTGQTTELEIPEGKSLLVAAAAGFGDYEGMLSDGSFVEIGGVTYPIRLDYRLGLGLYLNGPAKLKVGPWSSGEGVAAVAYKLLDSQPYTFLLAPVGQIQTVQVPSGQTLYIVAGSGGGNGGPVISYELGENEAVFDWEFLRLPLAIEGPTVVKIGGVRNDPTVSTVGYFVSQTDSPNGAVDAALTRTGLSLDELVEAVANRILAKLPDNYGIATKADLGSSISNATSQAIAQVQSSPNDFGLYDSTQYEANRITGVAEGKAEVTNNPTAYSLFTESSIMDMNMGGLVLKKGADANELDLELTIETKDSLLDNEWQVAERIARKVSMDGAQRQFLRVRAGPPYVAPDVEVFAHPTLGNILTDASGRVLYFFSPDSAGGNPTYSGSAWPYVTVPEAPKADAGITATLASSTFGFSGGPYLTVNGRPAYYYAGDSSAGQANGHGLGSVWWTIKPDGTTNQ